MTAPACVARQAMVHGASQHEVELAAALDLAAELQPAVIVEIGCDRGGGLYAWRQVCDRVYGITLPPGPPEQHGAALILGDSHDPATLAALGAQLGGDPVCVLIVDGDHTLAGVRADLAMYGPLVRPGGLVLIHDINCTGDDQVETWRLWPGLAAAADTTEIRHAQRGAGWGWGVIRVREGDRFA